MTSVPRQSSVRKWWPFSFSIIREAVTVDGEWATGRRVGFVVRWDRCPPL